MATVIEKIHELVEQLPPAQQERVLEFAQELAEMQRFISSLPKTPPPPGKPGKVLLRFKLPTEDVEAMRRALEDCERIELGEY